jgi:hypothetical protein
MPDTPFRFRQPSFEIQYFSPNRGNRQSRVTRFRQLDVKTLQQLLASRYPIL